MQRSNRFTTGSLVALLLTLAFVLSKLRWRCHAGRDYSPGRDHCPGGNGSPGGSDHCPGGNDSPGGSDHCPGGSDHCPGGNDSARSNDSPSRCGRFHRRRDQHPDLRRPAGGRTAPAARP